MNNHHESISTRRRLGADVLSGGPTRTAGSLGYTPALDGLRAFAVLGVLVSHFGLGTTLAPLQGLMPWGHVGVQLFFVLSGFLITNILLKCRKNIADFTKLKQALKAFYARRALRIFPLYYATIALVFCFDAEAFRDVILYHVFYLSNTASATYVGPGATGGLIHASSAHFWSLSVEEQFYLFWPLAVFFVPIRHLPTVGVCLILLAPLTRVGLFMAGYPNVVGYLPTATDALGVGAMLALYRSGHLDGFIRPHLRILVAAAAVGFLACMVTYNLDILYRPREVLFPLFGAVIYAALINLLLIGRLPWANWLLSRPSMVAMGRVSYAIYLTHTFVASSILFMVPGIGALPGFTRFAIVTAATIAVAMLSWRLFEGPINAQKSRFPYQTRPPLRSAAPETPVLRSARVDKDVG